MTALSANLGPLVAAAAKDAQVGDAAARSELFSSLYSELHRMARREAGRYGPNVADVLIGPTTLLHEAYMEISQRDALAFPNQGHFMAYAARAMRGLVIDRVRARNAQKRGGGLDITALDTEVADQIEQPELLTHVSEALDELALLDADLAHVVDLKFFCGFSMPEIAALQGVSERTVQRQWEKARLILFRALSPD
jgi:RNA polymerase sigma factor (TIGR02999 family)